MTSAGGVELHSCTGPHAPPHNHIWPMDKWPALYRHPTHHADVLPDVVCTVTSCHHILHRPTGEIRPAPCVLRDTN